MDRGTRRKLFAQVDLYPVTCEPLSEGRSNLEVLKAVIKGGARIVQLRDKECSKRELYQAALKFREVTALAGVLLMINDHLDVAMAVRADGVHLGQDDLPVAAARRLVPEMLIGASTHTLDEALHAQRDGADYVNIGPIFPTTTKEGISHFLGPGAIATIAPKLRVPFTVMGGITSDNLDQVLEQGATKVAVVTAVTRAQDITATVQNLRGRIRAGV